MDATRHMIENLARQLDLPLPDPFSQDWEHEVADSTRVGDLLKAYDSGGFCPAERAILFNLILGSFNDALGEGTARLEDWDAIAGHLIRDRAIHEATIHYWALPEETDIENCFPITPLVRGVAQAG